MDNSEEQYQLNPLVRSKQAISLDIPNDTLESLRKVAKSRDMTLESLLKFYIGQELKQDLLNNTQSEDNYPDAETCQYLAKQEQLFEQL